MSYSEDVRHLVIQYVVGGGSKAEAARIYGVCRATVYLWVRQGSKRRVIAARHNRKVSAEALRDAAKNMPDATLAELGRRFGVHYSTIHYALKRLGHTRKKNLVVSRKTKL